MKRLIATILASILLATSVRADTFSSALVPTAIGALASMGGGRASSTIYSTATSQTISTTSETTMFSTTFSGAPGGLTTISSTTPQVPYVNNRFHMRAAGQITTGGLFIGSGAFSLYFGAATVGSGQVINKTGLSVAASLTNVPFISDFYCTVGVLNGASTPVTCDGTVNINGSSTPLVASGTFNSGASFTLNMTWIWSSITGTPSLAVTDSFAEILY